MKIVVCIKQVYDTAQLKFDENTGEMRAGAELILDPFCEYAIETALRLKESKGEGTVIAVSVGGEKVKEALKKAIAIGCDEAMLLDDPSLSQPDSWQAAHALAKLIDAKIPDVSLILLGQTAVEGATGATGPQLAEFLDMPSVTFCKSASLDGDSVVLDRETANGIEKIKMTLPGIACTMKCDYEPRMANIKGVMRANKAEIPILSGSDIGLNAETAPTSIKENFARPKKQVGEKLTGLSGNDAAQAIIAFMQDKKLV